MAPWTGCHYGNSPWCAHKTWYLSLTLHLMLCISPPATGCLIFPITPCYPPSVFPWRLALNLLSAFPRGLDPLRAFPWSWLLSAREISLISSFMVIRLVNGKKSSHLNTFITVPENISFHCCPVALSTLTLYNSLWTVLWVTVSLSFPSQYAMLLFTSLHVLCNNSLALSVCNTI